METTEQDSSLPFILTEVMQKRIITVSAVAFNFDGTGNDPTKWADEINVLVVKNKKPPKKSKEGKPGGRGLPTGQVDQNENIKGALSREVRQESGFRVKQFVGELFIVNKMLRIPKETPDNLHGHLNYDLVPNDIHVFLTEIYDLAGKVTEIDEIDASIDPWTSLREIFEMPLAQNREGGDKNPDGIYYGHRKRLYEAIYGMVFEPESFIGGEAVAKWMTDEKRRYLKNAMAELQVAGLLNEYLPKEDSAEEVPA